MRKLILLGILAGLLCNPLSLTWIASLLVVNDGLERADAIIPLRGSNDEEQLRLDRAAELVMEGYAPTLLLSADRNPYYGQSVPALAEAYLKRNGFPAERLRFCENRADYTGEEARALLVCLQQLGAKRAIILTSEYHTRRTRMLFRSAFSESGVEPRIYPIYNSQYWDLHWWRRRRWAKTFLMETTSLFWSFTEQTVLSWRGLPPLPEATLTRPRNKAK